MQIAYEQSSESLWLTEPVDQSALDLLLGSDVAVVTTGSLAAVDSLQGKSGVALSANHLVALVLSGQGSERSLDLHGSHTTASESEDEVKGRLLLDVVIRKSPAILELLTSKDESLLIWRNTLFVLDFGPARS